MYDFNVANFDFMVYKSLSAQKPIWVIYRYNEESEEYEFLNWLYIGEMTAIGLNGIVEAFSGIEKPSFLFRSCSDGYSKDIVFSENSSFLSPEKLEKLIDYINTLAEMSEIAKKRGRGRKISHEDYEMLYPHYLKVKDIPFIADFKEVFDVDYAYDYLNRDDLLKARDYNTIIKKTSSIITDSEGTKFQEYFVTDLDAFFALDLEEVLFGTWRFPKFQMCSQCGEAFVVQNKKKQYCCRCDNETKRSRDRKKMWRKDKINILMEKVNDQFKQLIEYAMAKHEDYNSLYTEQEEFQVKLKALKKALKNHMTSDSVDVTSSTTEEQVISWLSAKRNELNERLKAYDSK